jgi:hypothetical protein
MKRLMIILLSILLSAPAYAASFPDTGSSSFDDEIGILKTAGAVSGYPEDGTFRPDSRINRAEFVKILLEYNQDVHGTGPSACFTDFHESGMEQAEWYYAYACKAKALGYIQGYPDGSFGGGKNINLAEALKIAINAKQLPLPRYIRQPDQWYDPYFVVGDELSLFGKIARDPGHLITRGEMAYIMVTVGNHKASSASSSTGSKPVSTSESHFLLNEAFYACSRNIAGEWLEAKVGPTAEPGYYFHPSDQEEFVKYCRAEAVIEYHAVLNILRRDDVSRAIEKYNTTEAWVRALGNRYIGDKDYLARILPAYSDMQIDCIIVVHTPDGTRFFLENEESHDGHRYLEVPAAEFLASLNNASDEDVTSFWLGLH